MDFRRSKALGARLGIALLYFMSTSAWYFRSNSLFLPFLLGIVGFGGYTFGLFL